METDIDARVKELILDIFTGQAAIGGWPSNPTYDASLHGSREDLAVLEADVGWSCGCYSEYTRDDSFSIVAKLQTRSGEVLFSWARYWQIPELLEQLYEPLEDVCSIERYERDLDDFS